MCLFLFRYIVCHLSFPLTLKKPLFSGKTVKIPSTSVSRYEIFSSAQGSSDAACKSIQDPSVSSSTSLTKGDGCSSEQDDQASDSWVTLSHDWLEPEVDLQASSLHNPSLLKSSSPSYSASLPVANQGITPGFLTCNSTNQDLSAIQENCKHSGPSSGSIPPIPNALASSPSTIVLSSSYSEDLVNPSALASFSVTSSTKHSPSDDRCKDKFKNAVSMDIL
ncbi:unnamed protein product [Protopolystoma xenopodis]|uniref:Uncharacterized protein n=1 Tax=Protopolystoma xenopodis TaxID=117903 RepID=A0A448WTM8_9PLAT|nr:unnamed protein product [Protopolystoma xenopodis]